MKIESLKLVCFSPTGTTKSVIQGVARGINQNNVELIDITTPSVRKQQLQISKSELLVIAVPVYMGRVPAVLINWLNTIKAHNTPTVCIVVYGNRVYDDALLELEDILKQQGCIPIACAAFVGEHSFSSPETPIAEGRPDENDLNCAELFGRKISEKLQNAMSYDDLQEVVAPGTNPYRGSSELWDVDFISVNDDCMQCAVCAKGCPVGAINVENCNLIDQEKCITCCACIKNCPQNARMIKPSPVKDAALRLNNLYKDQMMPELYL